VLGHIDVKHFLKPFLKEFSVGISMGAFIGSVAGLIISVWLGIPMLGVAVGVSIVVTMTLAAVLGFLVPYMLIKLKVDQAAGSAPIITSLKDISGLFIYFGLVLLLMSSYLEPRYEVTGQYVTVDGVHFFVDLVEEEATLIIRDPQYLGIDIPNEITVGDETFPVVGHRDATLRE